MSWLKLHRQILDSQVFSDERTLKVWLWCLCRANYRTGYHRGEVVPVGSFVTGRKTGSAECGISESGWERCIVRLVEWGMVTRKSDSRWTELTVCNWRTYQNDEELDRTAGGQPVDSRWTAGDTTSGQPADRIEERKKDRTQEGENNNPQTPKGADCTNGQPKTKKRKPKTLPTRYPPDFEAFWAAYPTRRRQNKPAALAAWERAVQALEDSGQAEPAQWLIRRARDYAASDQGRGQFCRGPTPWLNQAAWDDPREAWLDTAPTGQSLEEMIAARRGTR